MIRHMQSAYTWHHHTLQMQKPRASTPVQGRCRQFSDQCQKLPIQQRQSAIMHHAWEVVGAPHMPICSRRWCCVPCRNTDVPIDPETAEPVEVDTPNEVTAPASGSMHCRPRLAAQHRSHPPQKCSSYCCMTLLEVVLQSVSAAV